ncbi:MAG: transcription antitermination factor NusB [Arcicella sp.]|nr:transcription antitermination factor NusB [Arcicella sp.]
MVNRRLLRTKAFQNLYAFRTAERADYQRFHDQIAESFLPNLDLMIPKEQQISKLEGFKKLAELHYEELFQKKDTDDDIPVESKNAAKKSLLLYRESVKRERINITKTMVDEVENIYHVYLKMLQTLLEIKEIAVWDEQRRLVETDIRTSRLAKNKVLIALQNLPELETESIRKNVKWTEEDQNFLRKIFLDAVLPDTEFQSYLRKPEHTFEEDLTLVIYLCKTFILKHYLITDYFEEKDLNWGENKDILKSMLIKTFKISSVEDLTLQPLAMNWEDDKYYFIDLFNNVLDNEESYEKIILDQTKNWEGDRLAMTDLLILKLGLAEMINFPSIPVKVSINEYIELAKNYSTPKSGQFVNGLLDVISQKLQKENVIRKSGRGLIDNK